MAQIEENLYKPVETLKIRGGGGETQFYGQNDFMDIWAFLMLSAGLCADMKSLLVCQSDSEGRRSSRAWFQSRRHASAAEEVRFRLQDALQT